jgi:IS5 family transposase
VIADQGLGRHFGSSFKGESDLDWSNAEERRALLGQLLVDARIALQLASKGLRGYAKDSAKARATRESQALLSRILAQDIEDEPEDGGGPQIRRGTAKDRVISTTDPEMRHGHKSHSKGFNGYKASLVVDTKDGVILATGVRAANVADREGAAALVEAAGRAADAKVKQVLGDTAYGDTGTREQIEALGATVVAKAPPIPSKGGTFKRDRFRVNEGQGEARCPAGKRSRYRKREKDGWTYVFSRNDCNVCPLREQCTTSAIRARSITVTENSKELDKLRRHQTTKAFRRRYRKRVAVEHAIGRLRRLGIRQARYFGASKTAMQMALAAMAANIGLLAVCPDFGRCTRALLHAWSALILMLAGPDEIRRHHAGELQMALCRPGL